MEINKVLKSIQKAAAFDAELSKLENKENFMPAINKVAAAELKRLVEEGNRDQDRKDLKFANTKIQVDNMIKKAFNPNVSTMLRSNVGKAKLIEEAKRLVMERTKEIEKLRFDLLEAKKKQIIGKLQGAEATSLYDTQKKEVNSYVKNLIDQLQQIPGVGKGKIDLQLHGNINYPDASKMKYDPGVLAQRMEEYRRGTSGTGTSFKEDLRRALQERRLFSSPNDAWKTQRLMEAGLLRSGTTPVGNYGSLGDLFGNPKSAFDDIKRLYSANELGDYPSKLIAGAAVGIPAAGIVGLAAGDEIANALLPAGALVDEAPGRDPADYGIASAIGAGGALGAYQLAQLATKGSIDTDLWKNLALGSGGAALGALGNAWYRNSNIPMDLVGASKNANAHALDTLLNKVGGSREDLGGGFSGQQAPAPTSNKAPVTAPPAPASATTVPKKPLFGGVGRFGKAINATMRRHPLGAAALTAGTAIAGSQLLAPKQTSYI